MKKMILTTVTTTLTSLYVLAAPAPVYTDTQLLQIAQKSSEQLYMSAISEVKAMSFYQGQSTMSVNKGSAVSTAMTGFTLKNKNGRNNIYLSSPNKNWIVISDLPSQMQVEFGPNGSFASGVGNNSFGHLTASPNFDSIQINNLGAYDESGNNGLLTAQISKMSTPTTIEILNSMSTAVDSYTFMPMLFLSELAGPFLGHQLQSHQAIVVKDLQTQNAIKFSKNDTRANLGVSCRGTNKRFYWAVR